MRPSTGGYLPDGPSGGACRSAGQCHESVVDASVSGADTHRKLAAPAVSPGVPAGHRQPVITAPLAARPLAARRVRRLAARIDDVPPAAPNPAPLAPYDAVLVVSFGGPEGPEDVLPFLRTVTRGRGIPDERLAAVAEHYHHFAGVSPINAQNRALVAALEAELAASGPALPVYFGNRNWHPFLADTLRAMATAGVRRAVAFVTSAYSSYSGCRQYREDIARAQAEGGDGAPQVEVLRLW